MGQAVIGTNPLTTGGKGGCRPGDVGDFRGYRSRAASPPFSPRGLQLSEDAGWWKTWLSAGLQRGRRLRL